VIDTNFGKCKREEIVAKDPMERGITFKDLWKSVPVAQSCSRIFFSRPASPDDPSPSFSLSFLKFFCPSLHLLTTLEAVLFSNHEVMFAHFESCFMLLWIWSSGYDGVVSSHSHSHVSTHMKIQILTTSRNKDMSSQFHRVMFSYSHKVCSLSIMSRRTELCPHARAELVSQ
jgi:hypothetical protein